MTRTLIALAPLTLMLAGCAGLQAPGSAPPRPDAETGAAATGPFAAVRPQARPGTPAAVDPVDPARAEAASPAAATPAAAPPATGPLGTTIASLGDATKPGMWIETPLVRQPGPGTITYPGNGKSVQVELIPIDAPPTAGSRVSLQAMMALGAPLTGLPELTVSR